MRRIRIHIEAELLPGTEVTLPDRAANHAVRVLRLAVGDAVTLFNGDGNDYAAELIATGRAARARISSVAANATESPLRLVLAQALARGDKMDFIVQKAVELGVSEVVPLVTVRSEVKLDAVRGAKRLAHWHAVAVSACEQCGRARVPAVAPPQSLPAWLATLPPDGAARLALLPNGDTVVRELDLPSAGAILAIGPEGGFDDVDTEALVGAGFRGLQLGPRILRTETAGLAALAALQSRFGDG